MFHHSVGPMVGGMNLLATAAFGLSVAVQLNDPDPWLWSAFYGLAVLACLAFHFGYLNWRAGAALAALALGVCLWLLPGFLGQVSPGELFESLTMKSQAVEEAREAGGAALVALWIGFLSIHAKRHQDRLQATPTGD